MDGPRRAPPGSRQKGAAPVPPTARNYPEVVTGTKNPVRRIFHALLIACGWVIFVLFWYYIFFKGTREDASQAFVMLLITMIGVIMINWLWVAFNLSLYRIKGNRTTARVVPFTALRDVLGRILVTPGWAAVQAARIVDVVLDDKAGTKRYVIDSADPGKVRKGSP